MKTYLLNLPKNMNRLASMDRQLKSIGIEYEVFAIVGTDISKSEWKKHFDLVHSYCVNGRKLTVPELGCTMSHLEAYRRLVESGSPYGLILEDDVIFSPEFPTKLKEVEDFMDPNKPQVILFTGTGGSSAEDCRNRTGIHPVPGALCNDAYCITRAAACALLKYNYPIIAIADNYSRWVKRGQLELYRSFPISARQEHEKFPSDLGQERFKRWPVMLRPLHKTIRGVGVIVDYFWYLFTGR